MFEEDPERPTRPHLVFAGVVRDGQTMIGRIEMTPNEHLRCVCVSVRIGGTGCIQFLQVCGKGGREVWTYSIHFEGTPSTLPSCDGVQVGGVRPVILRCPRKLDDSLPHHHDPVGQLRAPFTSAF